MKMALGWEAGSPISLVRCVAPRRFRVAAQTIAGRLFFLFDGPRSRLLLILLLEDEHGLTV